MLSECGVPDILTSTLSLLLPGTHISLFCVKLSGVSLPRILSVLGCRPVFKTKSAPPYLWGNPLNGQPTASSAKAIQCQSQSQSQKKSNLSQICEQLNEYQLGLTARRAFPTTSDSRRGARILRKLLSIILPPHPHAGRERERKGERGVRVTCSVLVGKMLVVINCIVSRNFVTLLGSYSA